MWIFLDNYVDSTGPTTCHCLTTGLPQFLKNIYLPLKTCEGEYPYQSLSRREQSRWVWKPWQIKSFLPCKRDDLEGRDDFLQANQKLAQRRGSILILSYTFIHLANICSLFPLYQPPNSWTRPNGYTFQEGIFKLRIVIIGVSLVAQMIKNLPVMQET